MKEHGSRRRPVVDLADRARWLDVATRAGFIVSLCAFLVYVSGVLSPYVPRQHLTASGLFTGGH